MTTARNVLITLGLIVGLVVAGGGAASAATPIAPGAAASVTVTQPSWNDDNWDHNHDRDRDNGRWHSRWNDGWLNHSLAVGPFQCRRGGGHIDWLADRCRGGRFGGLHLRRW
ncbi:MAG: hypothetical protein M3Z25_17955 [Actinomycetota bacterium]|nr:hypothetical protein [Actinomycetota bacterium]